MQSSYLVRFYWVLRNFNRRDNCLHQLQEGNKQQYCLVVDNTKRGQTDLNWIQPHRSELLLGEALLWQRLENPCQLSPESLHILCVLISHPGCVQKEVHWFFVLKIHINRRQFYIVWKRSFASSFWLRVFSNISKLFIL